MGCDIHPVIEVRRDGRWEFAAVPDNNRNYPMFAALSGVRGRHDGEPTLRKATYNDSAKEAWPDDLGIELRGVKYDENPYWWFIGDHSFCWAPLADFLAFDPQFGPTPYDQQALAMWGRWKALAIAIRDIYGATDSDVRFLWGFDN